MFHPPIQYNPSGNAGLSPSSSKAQRALTEVELLRADVERVLMITEALWSILKEQHGYTDDELLRRVGVIDMKVGRMDGRVAATPPLPCPHCGRPMGKNRMLCLYCGKASRADLFQR